MSLLLSGSRLTVEQLVDAARKCPPIELDVAGLSRMEASRKLIDGAVAAREPVYGVTTGLGARSGEALSEAELKAFSKQSVLGRAHACGEPLPRELVRASLLVRLNTLLIGASGARTEVAFALKALLEGDITPIVGRTGSIGTGDLVLNATAALALIGAGEAEAGSAGRMSAADALKEAGLTPLELASRDGLALINHSGMSAASVALALTRCGHVLEALQSAASLSMEGFRANTGPFLSDVLNLKTQPGQSMAAEGILARLAGSALLDPSNARRLQDPLSIRNIPQVHGSVYAALDFARDGVHAEINGSSDNPACLLETEEIRSTGLYMTPHLTNVAELVSRAFAHMAAACVARLSKMLSSKFTDLPLFLTAPAADSNGFAPVLKTAESLLAEIWKEAGSPPSWPSVNADGVEDVLTGTLSAGLALDRAAEHASKLCAIELMVSAQAIELRGEPAGDPVRELVSEVRSRSAFLADDRPLGIDIDKLGAAVLDGSFDFAGKA